MKIKQLLILAAILSIVLFTSISRAIDITATNSGVWGDASIWDSGTVPGAADDADIPSGLTVTVETNATIQFIYDSGTVVMAPNSTLNVLFDQAIAPETTLNATAAGSTVAYFANPFFARQCNYYNLMFIQTNYVNPLPPFGSPWQYFNNFSSAQGPTPMTIAGDMTLVGAVEVQQGSGGAPITIGGNLTIGTGSAWDCSGDILTVGGNAYVYGLLQDLNGALGTNYVGGNVIVAGPGTSVKTWASGVYTNGWFVSDVTTWGVGKGLTNNGSVFGSGYGSISFNGTGAIAGTNTLKIPTISINGSYAIGTAITLITNTPTLNGTLVFDIANPKLITLLTNAGTALYYNGNLNVINSGSVPTSGATYKFFNSTNGYAGSFASTSYPSLPGGLSWDDSMLLTNGTITVIGGNVGSPTLIQSRNGGVLTLSWDSATYPGYRVQGQTNATGITTNWGGTSSGTVSPFIIGINPTNPPVFFRLTKP